MSTMPPDGEPISEESLAYEAAKDVWPLSSSPSEEYQAMMRGEITAEEYIESLKARVDARLAAFAPETRRKEGYMQNRIASVAFPASAIVILAAVLVKAFTGSEVPEEASAAATGLLTWAAFITLGAGEKAR